MTAFQEPDEDRLATASLFIVNPFWPMATAARWFSTHPSTAQRVRRLRAMAGRPAIQPPRQGWLASEEW
jgi:heat shock protein HtpX